MDFHGYYDITPTVEIRNIVWNRTDTLPIFEDLLRKVGPPGTEPDLDAINAAKAKMIRDGISADAFSTEGLANQINANPNAAQVRLTIVACYKSTGQSMRIH